MSQNFGKAETYFKKAILNNGKSYPAHFNLGRTKMMNDQSLDEAK